jgi:antitoxin MazE
MAGLYAKLAIFSPARGKPAFDECVALVPKVLAGYETPSDNHSGGIRVFSAFVTACGHVGGGSKAAPAATPTNGVIGDGALELRRLFLGYTIIMYIREEPMQVSKWGNSLAVRLPTAVVDALDLKEGDQIEIRIARERVFEVSRDQSKPRALARLRKLRRPLPPGFVFDREEANAR